MGEGNPPRLDFERILPAFSAAGGMMLSQVVELTGVEGSTIQNWVKRGWVAAPKGKKYGERQIARILIFSLLRSSLQLESIAKLMGYVNGDVEDKNDDIIGESELYILISKGIKTLEAEMVLAPGRISEVVDEVAAGYEGPTSEAKLKLKRALGVMLPAYLSSMLKASAEDALQEMLREQGAG